VQKVAEELEGKLSVVSVNVEQEREIAQQQKVSGIPSFAIVKQGEVVETFTGFSKDFIYFKLAKQGVAF
jgi:thioredoxin 1